MLVVQSMAPTLLRVLTAAAVTSNKLDDMFRGPEAAGNFAEHFSKPLGIWEQSTRSFHSECPATSPLVILICTDLSDDIHCVYDVYGCLKSAFCCLPTNLWHLQSHFLKWNVSLNPTGCIV
jgi:hypothetical protein